MRSSQPRALPAPPPGWDGVSSLGARAGTWQSACLGLLPLLHKARQRGVMSKTSLGWSRAKWDQGLSDTCGCTRRGHVLYCLRK